MGWRTVHSQNDFLEQNRKTNSLRSFAAVKNVKFQNEWQRSNERKFMFWIDLFSAFFTFANLEGWSDNLPRERKRWGIQMIIKIWQNFSVYCYDLYWQCTTYNDDIMTIQYTWYYYFPNNSNNMMFSQIWNSLSSYGMRNQQKF